MSTFLTQLRRWRAVFRPVRVELLGIEGRGADDEQDFECIDNIYHKWAEVEASIESRYGNEQNDEEKDELTEELNNMFESHPNLGDILFGDREAWRNEAT